MAGLSARWGGSCGGERTAFFRRSGCREMVCLRAQSDRHAMLLCLGLEVGSSSLRVGGEGVGRPDVTSFHDVVEGWVLRSSCILLVSSVVLMVQHARH